MNPPPGIVQRLLFLAAFILFLVAAVQSLSPGTPVVAWLIPGGLAAVALGLAVPW